MTIDLELAETTKGSGEKPDPEGTADRLLNPPDDSAQAPRRKRGRPRKSESQRSPQGKAQAPPVVDLSPPTAAEIAAFAMVWSLLWNLVAVRLGKLSDLTRPEQNQLAEATIPVVRKYAPIAAEYGPEIALATCVTGLIFAHLPPPETEGSGAEVIE